MAFTCRKANSAHSLICPCDCPKSKDKSNFTHSVFPPGCPTLYGAFGTNLTTLGSPFISGNWAKIYPAKALHKNLKLKI